MTAVVTLTEELKATVLAAGIDLVGITSAAPLPTRPEVYAHTQPREVLAEARAVVVAGFCVTYEPKLLPSEPGKPRGRFTPYGSRAFQQMERYCQEVIADFLGRHGFKSSGAHRIPIKPAAVRAGLGRYGKHGVVVTPELGSWVMFACLVTDAPLACTEVPLQEAICPEGCDRCLKTCPTGAITQPYKVDRDKCITHWLWGNFAPVELRAKQDTRLFGCAECLLNCPKNAGIQPRQEYPVPIDDICDSPELLPLLAADRGYYEKIIPAFPRLAGFEAMLGNAIIALGNIGDPAAVTALGRTLRHKKAQIRAYSAWALGRIGGTEAKATWKSPGHGEECQVREEIVRALRKHWNALREVH